MINEERLEKLLSEDESIYLEYKEKLDLNSNGGKAKFLREILSLANSPIRNGYLIIGVEDKTKVLVGVEKKVTEEQIQQVVSEWCRPPIKFTYQNIEHKRKTFGVMEIYPLHPPYTLKKATGFEEPTENIKKPNKISLRENQVFIRRGSTIGEANIDEILEMVQEDAPDMSDVVSHLDRINEAIEEIAFQVGHLRHAKTEDEPNEVLETVFASLIGGLLLGGFWSPEITWLALAAWPVIIIVMIISSVLRITHFGVIRTIFAGSLIGMLLTAWLVYGTQIPAIESILASASLLSIVLNGFAGAGIGLIAAIVYMFWGHPVTKRVFK